MMIASAGRDVMIAGRRGGRKRKEFARRGFDVGFPNMLWWGCWEGRNDDIVQRGRGCRGLPPIASSIPGAAKQLLFHSIQMPIPDSAPAHSPKPPPLNKDGVAFFRTAVLRGKE